MLAGQLAHHDPARVLLLRPPAPVAVVETAPAIVGPVAVHAPVQAPMPEAGPSYPLGMRIDWDGTLVVYSEVIDPNGMPRHTNHLETMVTDISEPLTLIRTLLH